MIPDDCSSIIETESTIELHLYDKESENSLEEVITTSEKSTNMISPIMIPDDGSSIKEIESTIELPLYDKESENSLKCTEEVITTSEISTNVKTSNDNNSVASILTEVNANEYYKGTSDNDENAIDDYVKVSITHQKNSESAIVDDFQVSKNRIPYSFLLYSLFIITTAWCVVDRFTVNLWPLGVERSWNEGQIGATLFQITSMFSGRLCVVLTNWLLFTRLKTTFALIRSYRWKWINFHNAENDNTTLHRLAGFLLIVPMLLHVTGVFFPVMAGAKMRAVYERKKSIHSGVSTPFFDPDNETVTMAANDIYRLLLMWCVLPILIYTGVSGFGAIRKNYSCAVWLHVIAALLFIIDNLRMKSHPHSHRFNTPIVLYWIMDRLAGIFLFRNDSGCIVAFVTPIGQHHALFGFRSAHTVPRVGCAGCCASLCIKDGIERGVGRIKDLKGTVANVFYIKHPDVIERAHPYTFFSSRTDRKSPDHYELATIIRLTDSNEIQSNSCFKHTSFSVISDFVPDQRLISYGPYPSCYNALSKTSPPPKALLLCATGSGVNFIISYIRYVMSRDLPTSRSLVKIVVASRELELANWIVDELEFCLRNSLKCDIEASVFLSSKKGAFCNTANDRKLMKVNYTIGERPDFQDIVASMSHGSTVFFSGPNKLRKLIKSTCRSDMTFYSDADVS